MTGSLFFNFPILKPYAATLSMVKGVLTNAPRYAWYLLCISFSHFANYVHLGLHANLIIPRFGWAFALV